MNNRVQVTLEQLREMVTFSQVMDPDNFGPRYPAPDTILGRRLLQLCRCPGFYWEPQEAGYGVVVV